MKLPVIVCVDDEKIVLDNLKNLLEGIFSNTFQVKTAKSSEEALELIKELISKDRKIPIVICDYLMPCMKGDVLLKKIKELSPSTSCILLTGPATLDTAKNMVEDGSIEKYIQKPWGIDLPSSIIKDILHMGNDNKKVHECISNLMERVSNIEKKLSLCNEKIIVWKDGEMFVFNIHDIFYFTSGNRCSVAVTNDNIYEIKETLDSLENQLKDSNFFRCHRCYIVNISNIIKITPWLGASSYIAKLKGLDADIPISRTKIKKLKEMIGLESK